MTTVTPAELGLFLDAVSSAPVALRDVPRIGSVLDRLVRLANGDGPIGNIKPTVVVAEPEPIGAGIFGGPSRA